MNSTKTTSVISPNKKYESKRVLRPVSLNTQKERDIKALSVIENKKFVFSEWVKNVLSRFTPAEISILPSELNMVPAELVEYALENQFFDLDEYLAAKGKKIVDINDKSTSNPQLSYIDDYSDISYEMQ